jgi:hypothetical protein
MAQDDEHMDPWVARTWKMASWGGIYSLPTQMESLEPNNLFYILNGRVRWHTRHVW